MSEHEPSDSQLIASYRKGVSDALVQLWLRYDRLVYGTAHGMLSQAETAEDIRQEVFLKVYNGMAELKDVDRFSIWLHRITRNACLSWLRRHRSTALLDENCHPVDPSEPVTATLEQQQKRTWLRRHIDRLPADYRTAIELYYFEDLRLAEISQFLDVKESTVKWRLYEARRILRQSARVEGVGRQDV